MDGWIRVIRVIGELRARLSPRLHVYVFGLLPRAPWPSSRVKLDEKTLTARIAKCNAQLHTAVSQMHNCTFSDISDSFAPSGVRDLRLFRDAIHLSREGYSTLLCKVLEVFT